jgi:hypothetical protein
MRYPAKVSIALERLAATDLKRASYAPLFHRALWRCGVNIPPPHFAGFFFNFAAMGAYLSVTWGFLLIVYCWFRYGMSPQTVFPLAVAAALLCSALTAVYFRSAYTVVTRVRQALSCRAKSKR